MNIFSGKQCTTWPDFYEEDKAITGGLSLLLMLLTKSGCYSCQGYMEEVEIQVYIASCNSTQTEMTANSSACRAETPIVVV